MQPKSNIKNVVLFFVLSALVIVSSLLLQKWLAPPYVPPAPETLALQTVPPKTRPGLLSELLVMQATPAAVPGVGSIAQLGTDAAAAQYAAKISYKPPALVKKEEPKPQPPPRAVAPQPPSKREVVQLGGDSFKLQVKLTRHGAAVQQVILTKFNAADSVGRPGSTVVVESIDAAKKSKAIEIVHDLTGFDLKEAKELVDGEPKLISKDDAGKLKAKLEEVGAKVSLDDRLNLVPNNTNDPSNVLFHYAHPEDEEENHPLDTLGKLEWTLDKKQLTNDRAVFEAVLPDLGVRITKAFTLKPDEYHVGLAVSIQRLTPGKPLKFRYQLTSGHGLPIEGEWYTNTYRNGVIGRQAEQNNFYRDQEDSRSIGIKKGGNKILKPEKQFIRYAGIAVQYFAALVVVDEEQDRQDFLKWVRPTFPGYFGEGEPNEQRPYLDDVVMRVITQPLEIPEKDPLTHRYLLYYGPVKVRLLDDMASKDLGIPHEVVSRYIDKLHLNTLTDTGNFGWWTSVLIVCTDIMHSFLGMLYWAIPNYGICIILLTVLVRGLMHPISRRQALTSIKMQALAPELKKLQEKLKGDPQAKAREQMALYRKHGVHPLGSCWIVFLQMPIFLGLYYALQESIHFRLATFLWIKNLAAPDMLIWWSDKIPWISTPDNKGSFFYLGPYFNLLPILAVTLMVIQQKFLMPPPTDENQEMQQKMMKYMMIFMGVVFYKVAAGLCLYFIISNAWGLIERKLLLPKAKPAGTPAADEPPPNPPKSGGAKGGRGGSKKSSSKNGQGDGPFTKVKEMWAELLKQAKKK